MRLNAKAFELIYLTISVATFTHTTWSAATTFQGTQPTEIVALVWWYIQGGLLAVAIDVGMLVAAHRLATQRSWTMSLSFVLAAVASGYTQVLYALSHAGPFEMGAGVSSWWAGKMLPLIEARVVLLPLALPAFAIIYAMAKTREEVNERNEETKRQLAKQAEPKIVYNAEESQLVFRSPWNGKLYGPYSNPEQKRIQEKGHYTVYTKRYGPPPQPEVITTEVVEDERLLPSGNGFRT